MRPGRVIALVLGCLLALPALGMLFVGGALSLAYAFGRDDDGYFEMRVREVESRTVAVTAEDVTLAAEPGSPDWLLDWFDADVRLEVTPLDADTDVFIGIARERDLDSYLGDVARDEITELDGNDPVYERRDGVSDVAPPVEQDFWDVSAAGAGTQVIEWEAQSGRWGAALMNADGSAGVAADVDVGIKAGFVLPLGLTLLGVGLVLMIVSVVLIVVGASGRREEPHPPAPLPPPRPSVGLEVPAPPVEHEREPVHLSAQLDPGLSRWLWLVKWILAIPHFIALFFLWAAFVVMTFIAGIAILFTGRYPRGIFDFNVGVMRWSFRVSHYATIGGIGTDAYPKFSLDPQPEDRVRLTVEYPERLSRGLVLVKWWLLAIPHYLIVAILLGTAGGAGTGDSAGGVAAGIGLIGVLVFIAGFGLLFTARYRRGLFDLIIGLNRWVYRVVAYAALMTDKYPPFRLDQGGDEPTTPEPPILDPHSTGTFIETPPEVREPTPV